MRRSAKEDNQNHKRSGEGRIYRSYLSMSTGPKAASAFNQRNQSKVDQDDSHSALFFLFQEVSKLASSTSNTSPPSKVLKEASMNNHFMTKKEEGGENSFQTLYSPCHHNLSCAMTCNRMENVRDDSQDGKAGSLDEWCGESRSPWKVLSLINLHCERLLHQRDVEELGYSAATLASAPPDEAGGGVKRDNVERSSRPFIHLREKQEVSAPINPVDNVRGSCAGDGYKQKGCWKDPEGGGRVQRQTTEKTDSVRVEFQEDDNTVSRQLPLREEIKFSVRQLKWNQDVLNKPLPENALHQAHHLNACLNTQLTFHSDDKVCKEVAKPALTLDHNANVSLSSQPQSNTQLLPPSTILLSPRSTSLSFYTAESSSCSENNTTASKTDCTHVPAEEKAPAAKLKSSICDVLSAISEPELCPVKGEETGLPSTRQWRTKTPRKQPHPSRSADIQDPDFQGVTFRMDTELDDTKEQCRLLITSKYSKELCKSVRKPRLRTRMLQKSLKTCSSDEECDLTTNVLKGKVCASCCTRKTPMWRDAEDGTPLCNACGIRYKKYRVRCVNCWHIPRKEGNSNSRCLKCGNFVRLTSAQRKHTA